MKAIPGYIYLFLALLAVTSCKKNNNFTVEGVVSGAEGQIMYLENVGISSVSMLDSVKLSAELSNLRNRVRNIPIFTGYV